jgi:hypothetical protein
MKLAGLDVEDILGKLADVAMGMEKASDKEVREMLTTMYEHLTGNAGPLIRAVPALAEPIAKDAAPIVAAIVEMTAAVGNSDEFRKAYEKLALAYATNRMTFFKAYKKAGFTPAQAFALVLQDAGKGFIPSNTPSIRPSAKSRSAE